MKDIALLHKTLSFEFERYCGTKPFFLSSGKEPGWRLYGGSRGIIRPEAA